MRQKDFIQWLQNKGYYDQLNIAVVKFLQDKGYNGQYNAIMDAYLRDQGYSQGTLTEKVLQWEKDILDGGTTPTPISAPTKKFDLTDQTLTENTGSIDVATRSSFTNGGGVLSFSLVGSNSGVTIDEDTGVVTINSNTTGVVTTTITVRASNSAGYVDSSFSLVVEEQVQPLQWTGPLPTTYVTEGEEVSIDLAPYLTGTPTGDEVFEVDGLPTGLSVNQTGPAIEGTPVLDLVAPTASDYSYFDEDDTEAGKVTATLKSSYEVPADHEVRIYFGETENPDLTNTAFSVVITPGSTYTSNGTWPGGTILYRRSFLRRTTDGAIVDVRELGTIIIATPADTTAPTLTGATANPNGETGGTASVQTDEASTVYARNRPNANAVADAATIQSEGQSKSGSAGVATQFSFTGLTTDVAYAVDFVAVDGSGNVSTVVSSASYTPTAVPAGSITIDNFSRDYSIFGSAPQLGRDYAEVPLSGTGTSGQVVEAKVSEGEGSALFSTTREAVLGLFDRSNPNGVQGNRADLITPDELPYNTYANVSFDIAGKDIDINAGGVLDVTDVNFDGWRIDNYGTFITNNCVVGNPTAAVRNYNAPWFVWMRPGSKWTANYTTIESAGTREDASRQLIKTQRVKASEGGTVDDYPIFEWFRCRCGGTGSDSVKPGRGYLRWCYFDAAVVSDYLTSSIHSDTMTVFQCHPTEGLEITTCFISCDPFTRPSDFPYPADYVSTTGDFGVNNVVRFDVATADDEGFDFGEVTMSDCVFRPADPAKNPEENSRPFQITGYSGISFTAPTVVRCKWLNFGGGDTYWATGEVEPVKWDQNEGPSGETLPPPPDAGVSIDAGPAPTIASWDDPALGTSGDVWFTVATVDGSGNWAGVAHYPRKAGWYWPTVRVQGGDGTEVVSSTRCGAGYDIAIHGQSNTYYPFGFNVNSDRSVAPPLPVDNPNMLQIATMDRQASDAPSPSSAFLTQVSDATPHNAGACILSNAINELTGGIPVMIRAHVINGRGLDEEVNDSEDGNWVDEQAIHNLASADGSKVDGHFQYLENGTSVGAYGFPEFIAAACFGKNLDDTDFSVPGTAGGQQIDHSLREFYDPNYTKFGWFSREGDHDYKFRDTKDTPSLTKYFLEKDEGFSPNRGWYRGYFGPDGSLKDDGHSGLLAYDGAPRVVGMLGLNMLQMLGALPGKTGVLDRIRLHPDGNTKAVAIGSSAGPLTTLRRSIGYFPTDSNNDNNPPRDKTRLSGKPDVVRFKFNEQALTNTEIRDNSHNIADEGWVWLYKNDGSDWTEADLADIGYAGSNSWHGAVFPDNWLDGFRYADICSVATGEDHVGAITISDTYPSDLGTNSAYRV